MLNNSYQLQVREYVHVFDANWYNIIAVHKNLQNLDSGSFLLIEQLYSLQPLSIIHEEVAEDVLAIQQKLSLSVYGATR